MTQRRRTAQPAAAVSTAELGQLVRAHCAAQDAARNQQQYEVLGMVDSLQCPQGVIRFAQHDRPGLGKDAAGGLLWLSDFPVLPEIHEGSNDFCAACLAPCTDCRGEGKAMCLYPGCGGSGQVKAGEEPCPGCVAKFVKPDGSAPVFSGSASSNYQKMIAARNKCTECGGYGARPKMQPCPCCKGTKIADCAVCRGTGKQPTGFAGGAIAAKIEDGHTVNICPECRGTMRAGRWRNQQLQKFIISKLDNYYALGPVLSMDVMPARGAAAATDRIAGQFSHSEQQQAKPPGMVRLHVPPDESGTPLMVLVEVNTALACQAWFFGGARFE